MLPAVVLAQGGWLHVVPDHSEVITDGTWPTSPSLRLPMAVSHPSKLVAVFALLLCSASCECVSDESSAACETLVSEILRIQELRGTKMKDINRVLLSYDEGHTDRALMLEQSRQWRKSEENLRKQVSRLYVQGRAADCL